MPDAMKLILNKSTDPYFNLALEEYLLCRRDENFFMLWRNGKSVIVGLNQNTAAEINAPFVRENGIAVARRLTGGGAVFHDSGNINYTFIENGTEYMNDYAHFSAPVISALKKTGVDACLSGRNDLLACGKKISGAAQCVKNGRTLHHGTLLYSADLSLLSGALNVSAVKIESKGIKSVRSRVLNIADIIDAPADVTGFMSAFFDEIKEATGGEIYTLSPAETEEVAALADEKYRTDDWNYGGKRDFNLQHKKRLPSGCYDANLRIENGVVTQFRLYGDYFSNGDISVLENAVTGVKYDYESIVSAAEKAGVLSVLPGVSAGEFAEILGL
ncbi:MAG: lipoate--protein ligase [Clostridia bacterium]|nr:lipoate--protein ligase [Clostridia bacterium]